MALRLGQRAGLAGVVDDLTRQLVALGQPERAAQLLLETEPTATTFYTNCLKSVRLSTARLIC